jgi:hypothetical protein
MATFIFIILPKITSKDKLKAQPGKKSQNDLKSPHVRAKNYQNLSLLLFFSALTPRYLLRKKPGLSKIRSKVPEIEKKK